MDRRAFLLSAAGAGLGLFLPKRLVTVFDMGRKAKLLSLPPLGAMHYVPTKGLFIFTDNGVWLPLNEEGKGYYLHPDLRGKEFLYEPS